MSILPSSHPESHSTAHHHVVEEGHEDDEHELKAVSRVLNIVVMPHEERRKKEVLDFPYDSATCVRARARVCVIVGVSTPASNHLHL